MSLTGFQRTKNYKKIVDFIRSTIVGINIPLPTYLTDDEINMFMDFIEYYHNVSTNNVTFKQKYNALVKRMTEHKQIEIQFSEILIAFFGDAHTCSSNSSSSSSSRRIQSQSIILTIFTLSGMSLNISSTHSSLSPPLYMNMSQFCIFIISFS